MEQKRKPLPRKNQKNSSVLETSLKLLLIGVTLLFIILVVGCRTGKHKLPMFNRTQFKPTEIILTDRLEESIYLYSKKKIDKDTFKSNINDFEKRTISQLNHVKHLSPQFFIELEDRLLKIYNSFEKFSPVNTGDMVNYFGKTLIRLWSHILRDMSLSDVSLTLRLYYGDLKVKYKDYAFYYSLEVVETIVETLNQIENSNLSREELELIKINIKNAKSPFKNKSIKLGLRQTTESLNDTLFLIEERLLKLELIRKAIKDSRRLMINNDSSLKLVQTIKDLKATLWVSKVDYPYLLGTGYVKVLPTDTYTVRQYGKQKNKIYQFYEKTFKYKVTTERWIHGSYSLENSTITMTVGRYVTVMEVYRIDNNTYLLDGEILTKETK